MNSLPTFYYFFMALAQLLPPSLYVLRKREGSYIGPVQHFARACFKVKKKPKKNQKQQMLSNKAIKRKRPHHQRAYPSLFSPKVPESRGPITGLEGPSCFP